MILTPVQLYFLILYKSASFFRRNKEKQVDTRECMKDGTLYVYVGKGGWGCGIGKIKICSIDLFIMTYCQAIKTGPARIHYSRHKNI